MKNNPWRDAFLWNEQWKIGVKVRYWPGEKEGEGIVSWTRTAANVQMYLGEHTAVLWVEGRPDCIALSHVEVIPFPEVIS